MVNNFLPTTVRSGSVEPNEELAAALARAKVRGRPAEEIAARAGVQPSDLSRWMYGRRLLDLLIADGFVRLGEHRGRALIRLTNIAAIRGWA